MCKGPGVKPGCKWEEEKSHELSEKGRAKTGLVNTTSRLRGVDMWGFPSSLAVRTTCNAGDMGSEFLVGRSAGEEIGLAHSSILGFPGSSTGQESACNPEDLC